MVALSTDITAAIRDAQIATIQDATIKTRFPAARDGKEAPSEGFFDQISDAEECLEQRSDLTGVVRRRFAVVVQDVLLLDVTAGIPTYRLIDTEQDVDALCIVSRVEVDLENETTTLELYG